MKTNYETPKLSLLCCSPEDILTGSPFSEVADNCIDDGFAIGGFETLIGKGGN